MDLWSALLTLLRRWYIFVPVLAVTMAGIVRVADTLPREYESRGDVVLLDAAVTDETPRVDSDNDPSTPPVPEIPSNPYSTDRPTALLAIVRAGYGSSVGDVLVDEGLATTYEVNIGQDVALLQLVVTADDPDVATTTVSRLAELLELEFERIQAEAGVPDTGWMRLQQITSASRAVELTSSRVRCSALGAAGLLVALGLTFAVDGVLQGRDRRRRSGGADAAAATGAAQPLPLDSQPVLPVAEPLRNGAGVRDGVADSPSRRGARAEAESDAPSGAGTPAVVERAASRRSGSRAGETVTTRSSGR